MGGEIKFELPSDKDEEMTSKHRGRRKRRQERMVLRSGGKFKINHNNPHGRTGQVHSKKTKGKSNENRDT